MLSGASDFGQKQTFEHHGYDKQQSKNTALSADVHSITQKIRFQAIAGDCWGCIRTIEAEMGWDGNQRSPTYAKNTSQDSGLAG